MRDAWLRVLARQGGRRRAIGLLALVSAGDFLLPALPTQTSVVALGVLQPRRAAWIAAAFAVAAAGGAGLLALLLAWVGTPLPHGGAWDAAIAWVQAHGVWAVALAAALPAPPRLLTLATLACGVAPAAVMAAVLAGRLVWFGLFLALLVHAPRTLARVPALGRALQRATAWRDAALAEPARGVAASGTPGSSGNREAV